MPFISGPHNAKYTFTDRREWVRVTPPLNSTATTLGAALEEYALTFNVVVRPCAPLFGQTEGKYFELQKPTGEIEWLVDVHITRENEEICPKQDLTFPLRPGDQIVMRAPTC